MKEREIKFTDIDEILGKVFSTLTIYPRKKKHRYSKYNCMYFRGVEKETSKEYYFKGEETDVIDLRNMECSMDLVKGNRIRLYHNSSNPKRGFEVIHCIDTLVIK